MLLNRHVIINKSSGAKITIETIPSSLSQAFELFNEPENVAVIITPPSSMEVVAELPKGSELINQMRSVVQVVTQLDTERFTIEPDQNQVSGEPDYRQLFVVLPNRAYVNRLYKAQPFYGALICHKLTHLSVTPYMRYADDVCLMTNSFKDENCIRDMSVDVCSK